MSTAKDVPAVAGKGKKPKDDTDYELEGFMSEIETDLREDELKKIWTRHSGLIIVFVAALLVGVAGFKFYQQREAAALQETARGYELAIQAQQAGKTDEAITQFTAIGKTGAKGYSALARLNQAALLLGKNDTKAAVAVYKSITADASADPVLRDLATLLTALHSLDSDDPKALEATLKPLTVEGGAFSASAQELTALLAARQGDTARAAKILETLNSDVTLSAAVRERATDLAKFYTGGGTSPAIVAPASVAPAPVAPAAAPPSAVPAAPAAAAPAPAAPANR